MSKVYEVMTQSLASCPPDTSAAQVAAMMQDRNIGDVLIVSDGRLKGIVTDRDLALQALTDNEDPRQIPIRKFMSSKVVTGEAGWSLEQAAKVMAKHQVRRLPIVQNGGVIGIVSLGDVAKYLDQHETVAKSLRAISSSPSIGAPMRSGRTGPMITFLMGTLATAAVAWLTWNRTGQAVRKQMMKSEAYHTTQHKLNTARESINKAASSKAMRDMQRHVVRNVRRNMNSTLNTLSNQVPALDKITGHKHGLFA